MKENCLAVRNTGNVYDMNASNVIDLTGSHQVSISEIHVLTSLLLVTPKQIEDHAKVSQALRTRAARTDELVDLVFGSSIIEVPSALANPNPRRLVAAA